MFWNLLTKITGFESATESESISQKQGSVNPDPRQNILVRNTAVLRKKGSWEGGKRSQ